MIFTNLRSTWVLGLAAALALGACGGPRAFSTTYRDNRSSDVAEVLQRLEGVERTDMRPVAVGATVDNQRVFAFDLADGRMLWTLDASPASAPLIAGDLVAIHEPGRLRIVRLDDGAVVVDRADEHMALMGADGDGRFAAVVMSSGGSMGARSTLWLLRDGRVHAELDVPYALGAPAVLGDLVFLPWNNVHLSVLSHEGQELARLRAIGDVVSRAFVEQDAVYFGQRNLYRFGGEIAAGDKPVAAYFEPERERLPGNPAFLPPANEPPPPVQSAVHSVRLAFVPAQREGRLSLAHDHLYSLFYRQLFALHPSEPRADWVYEHPQDVVGMSATKNGVWLADAQGSVTLVDHLGRARRSQPLGITPAVVRFRAEGFEPAMQPASDAIPLADQFATAAMNADDRLVPSRAMAVEMLGALPGAGATGHLVTLCEDASHPARIRSAACLALSKRTSGSRAVLAALERHYDFLAGTTTPPVGPLSEAAMRMKETRAVPALLAHLRDPATPTSALPQLMRALQVLGDDSVVEPVRAFLRTYHADEEDPNMLTTLELALDILVKHRGAEAAPSLEHIANDALGMAPLRGTAARLLTSLPRPAADDSSVEPGSSAQPAPATAAQPGSNTAEPSPNQLTKRHVERALKDVMEDLRQCLHQDSKHAQSARLTIVVGGEGDVQRVRALPERLLPCAEPLVRQGEFPANRQARRQQLTYTLER